MNSLVGEGISQIEHTPRGARLRLLEPLPLTLYQNGIIVGHGAFRPYQHPATQVGKGLERSQSHPASTHRAPGKGRGLLSSPQSCKAAQLHPCIPTVPLKPCMSHAVIFGDGEPVSLMQTFLHGHNTTNRSSPAERPVLSSTESLRCDHELSCCFSNACRTSWMVISPQSCSLTTPTVSPCRQVPHPAFGHKSLSCSPGQLRFSFSNVQGEVCGAVQVCVGTREAQRAPAAAVTGTVSASRVRGVCASVNLPWNGASESTAGSAREPAHAGS